MPSRLSESEYQRIQAIPTKERTREERNAYSRERSARRWEEDNLRRKEEQAVLDKLAKQRAHNADIAMDDAQSAVMSFDPLPVWNACDENHRRFLALWARVELEPEEVAFALGISAAKGRRTYESLKKLKLIIPDWCDDYPLKEAGYCDATGYLQPFYDLLYICPEGYEPREMSQMLQVSFEDVMEAAFHAFGARVHPKLDLEASQEAVA